VAVDAYVTTSGNTSEAVSFEFRDRSSSNVVGQFNAQSGEAVSFNVDSPKLWSPDSPILYDITVKLGNDSVESYTGFRSISRQVVNGVQRPLLNGKFQFLFGPLDQGYWPDGIYVAPNRTAMEFDLRTIKSLGMNMLRKHVSLPLATPLLDIVAEHHVRSKSNPPSTTKPATNWA
jgi:beta-galactosidase/beta-glucuronidase